MRPPQLDRLHSHRHGETGEQRKPLGPSGVYLPEEGRAECRAPWRPTVALQQKWSSTSSVCTVEEARSCN